MARDKENVNGEFIAKARKKISRAFNDLNDAKRYAEENNFSKAFQKSFFCAFDSISAIMLSKKISLTNPQTTLDFFNEHFVKQGEMPQKYLDIFRELVSKLVNVTEGKTQLDETYIKRILGRTEELFYAAKKFIDEKSEEQK